MDAQDRGTVPGLAAPELAHQDHVDLPPLGTAAANALVTPTSDNAHLAVGEVEGQRSTGTPILDQAADGGKRFATHRAVLAILGGFTLLELADGTYAVGKWGMLRQLGTLNEAEAFLLRMRVKP